LLSYKAKLCNFTPAKQNSSASF